MATFPFFADIPPYIPHTYASQNLLMSYSAVISYAYILLRLISSVHSRIHIVLYSNACMVRRSLITFTFHLLDKVSQFISRHIIALSPFFSAQWIQRGWRMRRKRDTHRIRGIELLT